jgi:hypothetical protein
MDPERSWYGRFPSTEEDIITPVSNIICTVLSSDRKPCFRLSGKIATSLIRIAATRIFTDPEQSILELPVNSLDAYGDNPSIGKFGLGWYSFLYWLIGHPKRFINMGSRHFDEAWVAQIQEIDGTLMLAYRPINPELQSQGTIIGLDAEDDPFSITQLMAFGSQLEKLKYVPNHPIIVNGENITQHLSFTESSDESSGEESDKDLGYIFSRQTNPEDILDKKPIIINLNEYTIEVQDFASGIPSDVLFESMLIPSISTKQQLGRGEFQSQIHPLTGIVPESVENRQALQDGTGKNQVEFNILVGNVVLNLLTSGAAISSTYLIQLSSRTPLPVSRDGIIFTNSVQEEFLLNLQQVYKSSLEFHRYGLYHIQLMFEELLVSSPNALGTFEKFKEVYPSWLSPFREVPWQYFPEYNALDPNSFIASTKQDYFELETWLLQKYSTADYLFYGKNVRFVENLPVIASSGGTFRFLMVKIAAMSNPNWMSDLVISLPSEYLLPKRTLFGKVESEELNKKTVDVSDPETRDLFRGLLAQIQGLNTYFDVNSRPHFRFDHLEDLGTDFVKSIILRTKSFLTELTLNVKTEYGHEREILSFDEPVLIIKQIVDAKDNVFRTKKIRALYNEFWCPALPFFCMWDYRYPESFSLLVQKSRNIYEYMVCCMFNIVIEEKVYSEMYDIILEYFRNQMDNPTTRLRMIVAVAQKSLTLVEIIGKELELSYRTHQRFQEMYGSIRPLTLEVPVGQVQFKLSTLIDYVFQEDIDPGRFLEYLPAVASYQAKSPLQVLEIAINEGTTKPWIESIITETFQNSVDAIRSALTSARVSFEILGKDKLFALTVTDPIGIPSEGLLSISIPFLSTKTPSELVTGEMGSGFFNVYRESIRVVIHVMRNGVETIFVDIPQRLNGRVVDVERYATVRRTVHPNGTQIGIVFFDPTKYTKFTKMASFITTVLPLSYPVDFNGKTYEISKKGYFRDGDFEFFEVEQVGVESYVLTKNIPLMPLVKYLQSLKIDESLVQLVAAGYVMNIRGSGYTPSQSRTRVRVSPAVLKAVYKFLYLVCLDKVLNKKLVYFGMYSLFFDQVLVRASGKSIYELIEDPPESPEDLINSLQYGSMSIPQYLINIYRRFGDVDYVDNPIVNQYLNLISRDPRVTKFVWEWLQTKRSYRREQTTDIVKPLNSELARFIVTYVNVYWSIGRDLNIPGTDFSLPVPEINFVHLPEFRQGFYRSTDNSIAVNINSLPDVTPVIQNSVDLMMFLRNPDVIDIIGNRLPPAILPHELTHAWTHSVDSGPHENITLILQGQRVTQDFDRSAKEVLGIIFQHGFTAKFLEAWSQNRSF